MVCMQIIEQVERKQKAGKQDLMVKNASVVRVSGTVRIWSEQAMHVVHSSQHPSRLSSYCA